jgi:hypothetical protein
MQNIFPIKFWSNKKMLFIVFSFCNCCCKFGCTYLYKIDSICCLFSWLYIDNAEDFRNYAFFKVSFDPWYHFEFVVIICYTSMYTFLEYFVSHKLTNNFYDYRQNDVRIHARHLYIAKFNLIYRFKFNKRSLP